MERVLSMQFPINQASKRRDNQQNPKFWAQFGPKGGKMTLTTNQIFKGRGGGSKVHFEVCYSPEYLVFRMGSFASQLATVGEI